MPAVIILKSGYEVPVEESHDEVRRRLDSGVAGVAPEWHTATFEIDSEKSGGTRGRQVTVKAAEVAAVVDHPRRPRI